MAEDWGTNSQTWIKPANNEYKASGRGFGKGRGYRARETTQESGFETISGNKTSLGSNNDDNFSGNRCGRGNDGHSGRGDIGGYRNRNDGCCESSKFGRSGRPRNNVDNASDGNRDRENNDNDGFGGGDVNGEEGGEKEERPPIYLPKELTDDDIFSEHGVTKGINFNDYENTEVKALGENVPPKIDSFSEAHFRELLLKNITRCGYDKPTPIQKYCIPVIMNGRDLMATAQTGSGKTGAFLLPIINQLLSGDSLSSGGERVQPMVVILSPTRELAIQIYENARKYVSSSCLQVQIAYGGTSVRYQYNQLMRGCHLLIATPGRLNDFLNKGYLSLESLKYIVLDEADRMLDMGFKNDINKFMGHDTLSDRASRQMLMFSATFSKEIQKLACNYLDNYIFVAVGIVGGACKDVEQNFIEVSRNEKKKELMKILECEDDVQGTLLFVGQKRNADFIASFLSDKGYKTTSIHGDRFQSQREEALREFKSRKMAILVATSVAARGLDISGVRHVINYDMPQDIDEYVHRIGRTGRLGNKGKATSFYDSSSDSSLAFGLVRILEQANQKVPLFLGDGTGGGYEDNSFGAHDIRQNKCSFKTDPGNMPVPVQTEEAWD